jgi:hypothetical protein
MSPSRRVLWLSLCCAAAVAGACFGGPTSDWPKGADGDDDESGAPPVGPMRDGGLAGGGKLDAGTSKPTYDSCLPDAGDAGLPDGGAAANCLCP